MNILSLEAKVLLQIYFILKKNKNPSIWRIAYWIEKQTSLNLVLKITNELQEDWIILKNEKNKIIKVTEKWEKFLKTIKILLKLCK